MTIRKLQEYIKYFTNYYQRKSAYTSIDSTPIKFLWWSLHNYYMAQNYGVTEHWSCIKTTYTALLIAITITVSFSMKISVGVPFLHSFI